MNTCQLCNQHYNDAHAACPHCATPAGMVANLERALVLLVAVRNSTYKDSPNQYRRATEYCEQSITSAHAARWMLLPYTGQYNEVLT